MVVTEKWNFFSISRTGNHSKKKKTHAAYGKLFVSIFSRALQNLLRIMNTIASILFENMN